MKALVIGAGAAWSTKDVENGVVDGLRAAGVEVGRYAYEHRLATSGDYLDYVYRRARKQDATVPKPSAADVQLHALVDVLPRALAHEVDWVVLISGMFVPIQFLEVIRRAGLPLALVLTESPYQMREEMQWARAADLVWTNERSVVAAFRTVQPATHYLPHAWRASVHTPEGEADVPAHDVVFVGTGFRERIALLEAVDWTGIDLGLYGNWQHVRRRSPLRRFVRGGVTDNARTAALYRRARVGLNLYREHAGWSGEGPRVDAESLNPRAYELAATGCPHVSTHRAEVGERFGAAVPTFRTADECGAAVRRLLADPRRREAIRLALPACVQSDTWTARGAQMAQQMGARLPAVRQAQAGRAAARCEVAA